MTNLTYLDLSMGLRFDICFEHALEFRLCAIFPLYPTALSLPNPIVSVASGTSKKNWEECSTCIRNTCVSVSLRNELHSIGFSAALIGLILFSSSVFCSMYEYEWLCVYNISIHQVLSEILRCIAMWFREALY